ncbi:MAG: fused MFS/spermidine synthase, partial [Phycisphaerales bacterium]|nr:fused MFS/spermidine synthase [Phycisphaerales bacterium]
MSTGGLAGGRHPVLLAAALAGAAVMTVELAAVRLLAPSFGTSTVVWTNVIGVVLAALALGHALGARWCRGESAPKVLRTVLLGAAVWVGALPFLAPHVAGALLPERLTLDEALPLLRWGSLAVSILVLAPPVVVLGSVGPLCVELVQRSGVGHAGTSGGWVLGSSTLGSLVGTFATTNLLVPRFGVPATFASATAALILAAFVLRSRGGGVAAATAVAIGAL